MSSQKNTFTIIIFVVITFSVLKAEEPDSCRIYNDLGVDLFSQGDYIKSAVQYKKALETGLKNYSPNNLLLGKIYNNIGVLKMNTWEFEESIKYLHKAKYIFTQHKLPINIAIVLSNMGANYTNLADYDLAEQYYVNALQILNTQKTKISDQRKAETLNRLGLLENVRRNYQRSANYYSRAINNYGKIISPVILHNLYSNVFNCYLKLNKTDSAYFVLTKALSLCENHPELSGYYRANTIRRLAEYYLTIYDKENALKHFQAAYKLYSSLEIDASQIYQFYMEFAKYYHFYEEYENAIALYQKALQLLTNEKIDDNINTPPVNTFIYITQGIEVLTNKAKTYIDYYNTSKEINYLRNAVQTLLVASELIDNTRNRFLSIESKLAIAENKSSIYQYGLYVSKKLQELTDEQEYLEQAYIFAEKSKSSILEAALQEQKARAFGGIPDSLLEQEENYKRDIAFYDELIYKEKLKKNYDLEKLANWQSTLLAINEQYEQLKNNLEKNYKNYYKLKYASPYSSLNDVQNQLDGNTSILEYALADSVLYIFQIDKEHTLLHSFQIDSTFSEQVNLFLNQFKHFNYISQGKNIYNGYQKAGSALYDILIRNVNTELLKEKLVIIPDNILSYIPFEALIIPKKNKMSESFSDMHYLLYDHAVSYSYSAHLFVENGSKTRRKIWNKTLSVAPQYKQYHTNSQVIAQDIFRSQRDKLDPLPFAMEEANLISSVTWGKELSGSDATEEKFMESAPKYDILHLAMHTLIDDNNPLYSRLVFYVDSSDTEAGFLTTNEIFSLKLKADMTVLSACSSGEGEYRKGEGVLSLARSFFYAGCPSLVMTLWNVDDESGLRLMRNYYKHLRGGMSKDKAMQQAKIEYISKISPDKQHPFYWSNYICIGNSSALYFPKWWYISFISLLALFLIITYGIKMHKNLSRQILSEPNIDKSKLKKKN